MSANEKELEQFLKVLVLFLVMYVRMEKRLITHKTHSVIPDTDLHQKLGIMKRRVSTPRAKTIHSQWSSL